MKSNQALNIIHPYLSDRFGIKEVTTRGVRFSILTEEELKRFDEYVRVLTERYDGDTDFYFQDNCAYPDITGDGLVTAEDYHAPESAKKAWAKAHIVKYWEIENEHTVTMRWPWYAPGLTWEDYRQEIKRAYPLVKQSNPNLVVSLVGLTGGEMKHEGETKF